MEQQVMGGYRALVSQVEEAAGGVKDPKLRRLAFDRVLSHLLELSSRGGSRTQRRAAGGPGVRGVGPLGYVEELVRDGFFAEPKTIGDVRGEIARRGRQVPVTSLSGPLQKLCQGRRLRRQKGRLSGKRSFTYANY